MSDYEKVRSEWPEKRPWPMVKTDDEYVELGSLHHVPQYTSPENINFWRPRDWCAQCQMGTDRTPVNGNCKVCNACCADPEDGEHIHYCPRCDFTTVFTAFDENSECTICDQVLNAPLPENEELLYCRECECVPYCRVNADGSRTCPNNHTIPSGHVCAPGGLDFGHCRCYGVNLECVDCDVVRCWVCFHTMEEDEDLCNRECPHPCCYFEGHYDAPYHVCWHCDEVAFNDTGA